MSERTYTEEEVRRREREAFAAGAAWESCREGWVLADPSAEAKQRYPITRKVPREVEIPMLKGRDGQSRRRRLRVVDGAFEVLTDRGVWERQDEALLPEVVHALADLLANPYEEVAE